MATNITHVSFGEQHFKKTKRMWQWNTGQVFVFDDLDLPDSYTARICNTGEPNTKPWIGDENGLEIPDVYFEDGRDIDVYIYLHPTEDSGQTEYHMHIPIIQQPPPTNIKPTETQQGVIDQTMAALNAGVEKAEGYAKDAEAWAKGTRDGEEVTEEDETYHNNAAYYADLAGSEAGSASGSAGAAADSAEAAGRSARAAAQSESNASGSATAAAQSKEDAERAKDDAQALVDGAVEAVNSAKTEAVNTVNQAGAAQVQAVNQAGATQKAEAKAQADAAARSAAEALQSKNDAAQAKTDAEAAKTAAVGAKDTAVDAAGTATQAKNDAEAASEAVQNLSVSANTYAPGTPASVQKTVDPETGAVNLLFGIPQGMPGEGVNTYHYGARWDKTNHAMVRTGSAAQITTVLTNFAHRGSVNANYANPFDNIYPWSGIKLCNIDIAAYMALQAGDSIRDCVKAWEGDPDFSYTDEAGVWRYCPEFYGTSYEDGGYVYFDITDKPLAGYVHYKERIKGRWQGRTVTLSIDGTDTAVFLPLVGMADKNISQVTLHNRAKAYNGTLDHIWDLDADLLLMIVEYADMNMQSALGAGCDSMYRQSSDKFTADATDSDTVRVAKSAGAAYCIPGAIFDIGTANGGIQIGSFQILSVEEDGTDLVLTLDRAVTVTTANFWSVHGICNVADEEIGSMSGYIGTNGKCNAYYRGVVMWGNLWFYILGAYRETGTQHIWIAHDLEEADAADALNTAVHEDTGLVLPSAGGYVQTLGRLSRSGNLAIPPFCTAVGGSSTNPVGDYFYTNASAGNTVLRVGGSADNGASAGPFYGAWHTPAAYASWSYAARPVLKSP